MRTAPDPDRVKVQLNVPITWTLNHRLDLIIANNPGTSKAKLVRWALETAYPTEHIVVTPPADDES